MRIGEIDKIEERDPNVGVLCEMGAAGDVPLRWNRSIEAERDAARAHFESLRNKGYSAFKETHSGGRGEMISTFDGTAERIIMIPPVSGGR